MRMRMLNGLTWLVMGISGVVVVLSSLMAQPQPPAPEKGAVVIGAGKQPQGAFHKNGTLFVVVGRDNAVWLHRSTDKGATFLAAEKIGDVPALMCGMRRGPRIAISEDTILITAIGGVTGPDEGGNILCWRSTDAGKTWSQPTTINAESGSAREGMHGLAAGAKGQFAVAWLDLRNDATEPWCAVTTNGGEKWDNQKRVYASPDGHICECCHPSVAIDTAGSVWVMFRNWLNKNRDLYLARSKDNGKTWSQAAKLGDSSWALQACPMDGGAVVGTGNNQAVTVWRRDKEVFRQATGVGQKEQKLGPGLDPWATMGPGGAHVVWLAAKDGALKYQSATAKTPDTVVDKATAPVVVASSADANAVVVVLWEADGKAHCARVGGK